MVRQRNRQQGWGNNNRLFQCKVNTSTSLLKQKDWSEFSKTTWKKVQWLKTDKGTWKDGEAYRLQRVGDGFKCGVCKKDVMSNINRIRKEMGSFFVFSSEKLGGNHIF